MEIYEWLEWCNPETISPLGINKPSPELFQAMRLCRADYLYKTKSQVQDRKKRYMALYREIKELEQSDCYGDYKETIRELKEDLARLGKTIP
jgi:FMN phosphatase YigB (HAD superfamily)